MTISAAIFGLILASFMPQKLHAGQEFVSSQRGTHTTATKASTFEELSKNAERARNENRDDDAIALYRQALSLQPSWPEGLWYLSTLFYEKDQYIEARDTLRRFVSSKPDTGPGWALLGMSEFQTHEYTRSLDHLRRAMSFGMGDRKDMAKSVFYFVAVLSTRFEQYDEAMNLLMATVKSDGPSDLLVEPIGLAALRLPLLPVEIPPDKLEMVRMAGRGALAVEAQQRDDAEKLLSGITKTYPNEFGVHFLYGTFLLSDVRPEEGVREMKRELEISPSHVPARLRLAEEYLNEQKADEALPLAEEAVHLDSKRASAHLMLGEVLVAKGDLVRGIQELETARSQEPQNVRSHWDLLRAYTAAGRNDDAKHEKEEIERLNRPAAGQ